jgi:hypothetical protein
VKVPIGSLLLTLALLSCARAVAQVKPPEGERGQPRVLMPSEGAAGVVFAQVPTYIFFRDFQEVMVLQDSKVKGVDRDVWRLAEMYKGSHLPPFLVPEDLRQGMAGVIGVEGSRPALRARPVPLNKLADAEQVRLAVQPRPLRMAVVVAAFPYEDQLKEFRQAVYGNKIRLRDVPDDVIEEVIEVEHDGMLERRRVLMPAFRFREVEMQRRVVDATDWPVDPRTGIPLPARDDGWGGSLDEKGELRELIELRRRYRTLLFLTGNRIQTEDEALTPTLLPGLWMPRLQQMREGQYPDLMERLPTLRRAVDEFNKDPRPSVKPPRQLARDAFDPFSGQAGIGKPERDPRRDSTDQRDIKPITHVLIQLVDTDIEPGKIYEYRIRVRMTNPNFGKKNVANPRFADDVILPPPDWYVIPDKVIVPPELEIYPVDQGVLDKTPNLATPPRDATVMQIHKWIDLLRIEGKSYPVGEWSVAERVVVHRGEAIDRNHKVEVPVWNYAREQFVLLGAVQPEPGKPKPRAGIDVPFGNVNRPWVLVDFEGGASAPYTHTRKGERPLKEAGGAEVLVLSPEGKLLAHNGVRDTEDPVRLRRLAGWKARLDEVRKETKPSGGSRDPFDRP